MKISLDWLNDFVDIEDYFKKPESLAEILTRAGLEVEEIHDMGKELDHVVIGLILEKDQHPNADKLSVCKVTTGEGVVHQIVCGAQNHKANDRVIVALPGAVLPGDFAIKKSVLRGVESGGMLCSYKELGLPAEGDGIAILPDSAKLGMPYADYAGMNAITFELKVTPNRADCLSHFGLAREISCLLNRPLKERSLNFKEGSSSTREVIQLEVKKSDLCPRYSGRAIKGVQIKDSPSWLAKRLESVGLNSINNVVDVTNYVMMEMGQPLHAFDVRYLAGQKIIVDQAQAGEKFITLDGTEITLKGEELMIKDAEKSVAMAGVVGGKNSGVNVETTDIFLEGASFLPMVVRKTSRTHGVNTDSAYRFSRGVDISGLTLAMERACQLIQEVAGGEICSDAWDVYPSPQQAQPICITTELVSNRLGYEVKETLFLDYLKRLGCQVQQKNDNEFEVTPPSFRFDLEVDMDLVEEYARIDGYDKIPEALPKLAMEPTFNDKAYVLDQEISTVMREQGFTQAMNFAFVGEAQQNKWIGNKSLMGLYGLEMQENSIKILNPLNEEMDVMRSTLVTGLLKNLQTNFHYGNHVGRLFEVGPVLSHKKTEGLVQEGTAQNAYVQTSRLGLLAWGAPTSLWQKENNTPPIFEIKAAVEALLKKWNITAYTWTGVTNKGEIPAFLHRGQFAGLIIEGKKVGFIGTLHPVLQDDFKVRVPVALAELDLEVLYKTQPRPLRVEALSRFPSVERDYAFVMDKSVHVGDVMNFMKKTAGPLFHSVTVFDVYQGENLDKRQKSVAFRLVLQDKKATLQESTLNELQTKLIESLKTQFSLSIR